jgi:hypothetical protein
MQTRQPRTAIGVLLVALGFSMAAGYWIWGTHLAGSRVATLDLRAGKTIPLMGINVTLEDDGVSARMGSLALHPSMAPLHARLAYREPIRPLRFRYTFRVVDATGQLVHQRSGTFSTWFRGLPGLPALDLGRFGVAEPGPHYAELKLGPPPGNDLPGASDAHVPDVRLELRARAPRINPLLVVGWLPAVVIGVALLVRRR